MAFRSAAYAVVARIFKLVDAGGFVRLFFGPYLFQGTEDGYALRYEEPTWTDTDVETGLFFGESNSPNQARTTLYAIGNAGSQFSLSGLSASANDIPGAPTVSTSANLFAFDDTGGVTREVAIGALAQSLPADDVHLLLNVTRSPRNAQIDIRATAAESEINMQADQLKWNGAGWQNWNPVLLQPAAVAATINHARYFRFGPVVFFNYRLTVTGAGVAGQPMTVSLPIQHAIVGIPFVQCGSGTIFDTSVPLRYEGTLGDPNTGNSVCYITDATGGAAWGQIPFIAIAAGDVVEGWGHYQCA